MQGAVPTTCADDTTQLATEAASQSAPALKSAAAKPRKRARQAKKDGATAPPAEPTAPPAEPTAPPAEPTAPPAERAESAAKGEKADKAPRRVASRKRGPARTKVNTMRNVSASMETKEGDGEDKEEEEEEEIDGARANKPAARRPARTVRERGRERGRDTAAASLNGPQLLWQSSREVRTNGGQDEPAEHDGSAEHNDHRVEQAEPDSHQVDGHRVEQAEQVEGHQVEEQPDFDNPDEFHSVRQYSGMHAVCANDDYVEEHSCVQPDCIPNCRQCKRALTVDGYMIGARPLNPDVADEEAAAHLLQNYSKQAVLLAARHLLQEEIPLPPRTFGLPHLSNASGVISTAHSFCGIPCMRRYSAVHPTFNSSEVTGLITDMGIRAGLSLSQLEAAPDEGLLRHQGGPLSFDEYSHISSTHTACVLDSAVFERRAAVYQMTQRGQPREVVSRYRLFLHARQHLQQQQQQNQQRKQQPQPPQPPGIHEHEGECGSGASGTHDTAYAAGLPGTQDTAGLPGTRDGGENDAKDGGDDDMRELVPDICV